MKLTFVLTLVAIIGCSKSSTPSVANHPTAVNNVAEQAKKQEPLPIFEKIEATNLFEHFATNIIQADKRYIGKRIQVSGSVRCVRKTSDGGYYCGLLVVAGQYEPNVVCYIAKDHEEKFSQLSELNSVVIEGEVVESKSPAPGFYRNTVVKLANCKLIAIPEPPN